MPLDATRPALHSSCEQSLTTAPAVVLDTNAVLDWLLFADPSMAALGAAIEHGSLRWLTTATMHGEFRHVLQRGLAAARGADITALARSWARHAREQPDAAASALRCRDRDDQKFLDLALAGGVRWLVSRDRALLRLRRPAAARGLAILPPQEWRPG
jgi:predicted nucleic acid-binding protein